MPSLRVELKGDRALKALQELEQKQLITILHEPDLNSYSLPGASISDDDFRKCIEYAEGSPAIDLKEAKQKWTERKNKLQKLLP
jgi:hypothetical protein